MQHANSGPIHIDLTRLDLGRFGVNLFFVIWGYLMCATTACRAPADAVLGWRASSASSRFTDFYLALSGDLIHNPLHCALRMGKFGFSQGSPIAESEQFRMPRRDPLGRARKRHGLKSGETMN
jgi:hypothetical protein